MCRACEAENTPEIRSIYSAWVVYEKAKYVVIGWTCSGGGILASADDEFTAHRYGRTFRKLGWQQVEVAPECDETYDHVNRLMDIYMATGRMPPSSRRPL